MVAEGPITEQAVIPNPHPEMGDPPAGFKLTWHLEEDPDWRLVGDDESFRPCRGSRHCPGRVVAALQRKPGHWWFYCEAHLYGRKLDSFGRLLKWRWEPR